MYKRKQQLTILIIGIFILAGIIFPITVFAQDYEDSPFGFIQGEYVQSQGPSAEYLNDLGVYWDKIAPAGTPIFIETDDPNNINFQTDVNFSVMDAYLQTLVVDNGINVPLVLMVFVKVNGEITKLDLDDYEEFGTVLIERYDGDGVDDAPGSPLIKYWSLGGGEMNKGVAQGVSVEDRPWPLTEAETAEYIQIGYDLIKELHPEFRVRIDGPTSIESWQQGGDDDYYYNLISELTGNNECSDLIFDYHAGSNPFQFKSQIGCMNIVDEILNEFGYNGNEIWTTDCGGSWEEWQGFTEAEQAGDVVRRYAYTIANGQEKLYWTRVEEYNWPGVSTFDYMGLIHNPINDPAGEEKDWKKLSYYTYKLMVEKLEGSDWDNVETVIDGTDYVYAYKFSGKDTNDANGHVYALWWAYFDDSGYSGEGDTIDVDWTVTDANFVLITRAVPNANDGSELEPNDYPDFFLTETKPVIDGIVTVVLGENPVFIEEISNTSIEQTGSITPNEFQLNQNYPNPFNPQTTISYQLPVNGDVTLKIYNMLGQEIQTLINENKPAGYHSVVWNGKNNSGQQLSSGIYFYSLKLDNNYSITNRMLLLK